MKMEWEECECSNAKAKAQIYVYIIELHERDDSGSIVCTSNLKRFKNGSNTTQI